MMSRLIELQHWLYGGMAEGLKSAGHMSALPALLASAVLFGALHALMPGHGKSVLVSYHLGQPGRLWDGLLTGIILALTHVGSAVLFIMVGIAVISRSLAAGGRAPAFETASAVLIVGIGIFLLWRSLRPHDHVYTGDGRMLAFVTGLVPCPLTTFILTYAIAKHELAAGFAAVGAMAIGVIATLVSFAVAAVYARGRFMQLLARSEALRLRIGQGAEVAGACAVIALGLVMLSR
jgi:nickel/cobalt transporter (NicO) family protein